MYGIITSMSKEVKGIDLLNSMFPATPLNSFYAERILEKFANTTGEEAKGPIGQEALAYALSLGGLAAHLSKAIGKHPTRGGLIDVNANHLFGSEIILDRSLPQIH